MLRYCGAAAQHPVADEGLKRHGLARSLLSCFGIYSLVIAPTPASAQSAAVESLGARPCADLTKAQEADTTLYAACGVWIGGYLTAANAYEDDTFDLTPWQTIELATAQIAAACGRQPDATIAAATASYVQYLKAARLAEPSPLIQLRAGDRAMFIYRTVLEDIRARLQAGGSVISEPEGEFGPTFGAALLRYQRENDLPETGLPDTPTLLKLMR